MHDMDAGSTLLDQLPVPLPPDQVRSIYSALDLTDTHREYSWNGWTFDVPPGVFLPSANSKMFFERLLDGRIETRGRRYLAMGCGVGIEAIAAGTRGAAVVYAADVHPESVQAAERHFRNLLGGQTQTRLVPVIADLLDGMPEAATVDVVTFNPPAVSQQVSDDADVMRNVCAGAPLVARFFDQLAAGGVLAPDGEVYLALSNTAQIRVIVEHAIGRGFQPEIIQVTDWDNGLRTYLFRFTVSDRGLSAQGPLRK